MATFYNQASLSYNGAVTNSNTTEGELKIGLAVNKTAFSSGYTPDGEITYLITLSNNGNALSGLNISDNLGAYQLGLNTIYPLGYVEGSVLFFVNGISAQSPTVTEGPPLVFSNISLAAGAVGMLIYRVKTNVYAPLASESVITNTVTATATGLLEPVTASASVTALDTSKLTIAKAICPNVITDNGTLSYTFIIENSGNTAVEATANAIVSDTFNPILNPITVTLNGTSLVEGTDYSYNATTGEFSTNPGIITVAASTYTQDETTGQYSVTPGTSVLTVVGTV